jgi:Uma2 family endonuclease
MALQERELPRFTAEEYLTIEREALDKSEFVCGQIYAMSGSSPEHDVISVNIVLSLGNQLKGKPCQPFTSNMRMRTVADGLYSYPDVSVVCGDWQFHDNRRDTITNPTVIVEVLSPSTERFDRNRKFDLYKAIESLSDYILVAQDRPRIEHFRRMPDGTWSLNLADGLESGITVESIGCTLLLKDVYERVVFRAGDS